MPRSLVAALPGARRLRPADGMAFLPAALEIVEPPPSPIGRAIALTLVAAFCAALAWASLGTSANCCSTRPASSAPSSLPSTGSASEPQGRELVYAAHISLDRTAMSVDGSDVALSPGMAVTVEIKTGAQRVITYLLSPLLRYTHDSPHER